jgi:hypothetical protein
LRCIDSLRSVKPLLIVFFLMLFLTSVPFGMAFEAKTTESYTRLVQIQCLRSESQDEHLFLDPLQSLTFNATEELNGLRFVSIHVQANSTNQSFLRELNSNLFIESYDYFGGLGGYTQSNNVTLTNPTASKQELFLRITRNFMQTTYVKDTVVGQNHTIEFTNGPASNRVFVRWGVFAALKYVEINQTEANLSNIDKGLTQVRLEFLPTYASFQLPSPQTIEGTHFLLRLEERDLPMPSGYCYVSSLKLDHKEVVLGPQQQVFLEAPKVNGWSFFAAAAYTNLTQSLFPKPYPFELINMAVWDPNANPMLLTATDTAFGIKNLSNATYSLGLDVLYYYWQNQSGLTFSHEAIVTNQELISHRVFAGVTNKNVGADVGLTGQYLRFQVPGRIVSFEAPNPVGKYDDSYIPLSEGSYVFVTEEEEIKVNMTSNVDDISLSNRLSFDVTYNGEPHGNAFITIKQTGSFTSRTYNTSTDQYGKASIIISSSAPEFVELTIRVSKDQFNYVDQKFGYGIGASWIATIMITCIALLAIAIAIRKKHVHLFKR